MPVLTREELEGWKRPALQQKCKELGIKANSKTEVLIGLILSHYESEQAESASGPSRPTTSRKRKAAAVAPEPAEDVANDEQPGSDDDGAVSAPQRLSTRRRAGQNSTAPPPAKVRRLATRTRTKVEPVDDVLPSAQNSPRRGRVMEVVLATPPSKMAKGKGKARETAVKAGPSADDARTEIDDDAQGASTALLSLPVGRPLEANSTSVTVLDTTADVPLQPQLDAHETRIADLELQIRNARKSGDDSAREVLAVKAFQHAIQQAFGDHSASDTLDSMSQMAKLRDVAPKLITLASGLDAEDITSRIDAVDKQLADFEVIAETNRSTIAELTERIRELEEGKSTVGDLDVLVRKLQSDFNRIPDSVFESSKPEDSASDRMYTIIRAPSRDVSVAPSSSQHQRPSSRLSIPPEDILQPPTQDQNTGRSSSVARSIRASRPPLAEKEGIRVGQPDVEVETADPRRSIRRLAESLPPSTSHSASSSRARSTTPTRRQPSSAAPTPSRGKGKGRMLTKSTTPLDTVDEDGDMDMSEEQPAITALATGADPFTPTLELPRSPPVLSDASRRASSGSPPPSASKPYPKVPLFQGLVPTLSTTSTLDDNGPIAELPFKLVASPVKPLENSNHSTSRPAPSGRVGRTPHRSQIPYTRPGGSRTTTSESVVKAPAAETQTFNFALPGPSASTAQAGSSLGATNSLSESSAGFITPERLGANFNLFPTARIDFGRTPGGLAFKTTGRAPPGTPAVTTTLFGTEVARDTRFADLPYDPDASRESLSWEGLPVWPAGVPRNASNQ